GVSLDLISEPEAMQLIRKLAEFPEVVLSSAESREPHHVTHYLHELASLFHTFYNQYRVLDATQPNLTQARLVLVDCVRTVLKNGLRLLGVSAPEAM
ncbi:MAG: DALR anticodon-binding domain-containing protein, partial [Bacteroidota bacterium]